MSTELDALAVRHDEHLPLPVRAGRGSLATLKHSKSLLPMTPWALITPFLMNTAGWLLTENGRQLWIVQGFMKTVEGVSKSVTQTDVIISLAVFVVIYVALGASDVFLMLRYGRRELLRRPVNSRHVALA